MPYAADYRTKVFRYNLKPQMDDNDDIFWKYFVVTDMEIWACSGKGTFEDRFYRIVSKLHGTSEIIKNIFYYDGVEVKIVPALSNNGDRKIQTVEIREVKYLRASDYKVLRYDGFVTLKSPDYRSVVSMFKPLDVFEDNRNVKGIVLHQDNVGPKITSLRGVGTLGEDLSVGSNPKKSVGTDKDIAVCTRVTDDPRLYTPQFLPKARKLHPSEGDNKPKGTDEIPVSSGEYVTMDLKEFSNYFTVTHQELWRCTIKEQKDSEKIFLRRVTELIGRKAVKSLEQSQALDVWNYKLKEDLKQTNKIQTTKSLKLREYYYFLPQSNEQVNFCK
ncbi:hypothetical protein LSTR_LSTR010534 [Laodelphax striatellus]|uniref:Uncharacterized protein n=1 Tax=Laodelphax striatellus TaxID=195883 RepID=A0A482X2S1_LAOST|nr:hypothetical protein LSTR_LSTR010534 [Laodelphax striatellus]